MWSHQSATTNHIWMICYETFLKIPFKLSPSNQLKWSGEESDLRRSISELSARKIDVTNFDKIVWQALFDKRDEKSKSIYVMSSVVSPEGQVKLNSCNLAMHVITTCYGILTCQYISGVTIKCKSIQTKHFTWLNKTAILREQSCEMLAVSDASRIL